MKPTDTLTTLFSHNLWANLCLLNACAPLTDEQLNTTILGAYGSILDTLQHIVTAEQSYFSRISTGQPHRHPADALPLTIAEMVDAVHASGTGLVKWASTVQPNDAVQVDWNGVPRDAPKTVILTQVINHATEHRAQIMAIMTQLGIQSPALDGWSYFDETVDDGG